MRVSPDAWTNGDLVGPREERQDVRGERVGLAASGQQRGVVREAVAAGQDVADPTAWVVHVALEPWDDVDVEVRDSLARGGAGVEADVVAVRRRSRANVRYRRYEHRTNRCSYPRRAASHAPQCQGAGCGTAVGAADLIRGSG
jgi:hypothetical protein